MKLLIDECLPRTLKRLLGDHECRTVQEMGWSGKKNGVLLSLAELEFDVLVTVDQGMGCTHHFQFWKSLSSEPELQPLA